VKNKINAKLQNLRAAKYESFTVPVTTVTHWLCVHFGGRSLTVLAMTVFITAYR